MKHNAVRLSLPAKAQYMVMVRLMSASLAGLAGFDVEAVEDIRSAVAEACLLLLPQAGEDGELTLEFFEDAGLRVRVLAPCPEDGGKPETEEQLFSKYLLSALLDEANLITEDHRMIYELYRALPGEG